MGRFFLLLDNSAAMAAPTHKNKSNNNGRKQAKPGNETRYDDVVEALRFRLCDVEALGPHNPLRALVIGRRPTMTSVRTNESAVNRARVAGAAAPSTLSRRIVFAFATWRRSAPTTPFGLSSLADDRQ